MAIYLDYNATTPLASKVIDVIHKACHEAWANPSSSYERGQRAKLVVEEARRHIVKMLDAEAEEAEDVITFTSGGTEANHTIIKWAMEAFKKRFPGQIPHIVTSNIEHCAAELPLKYWEGQGRVEVSYVKVQNGLVVVDDIVDVLQPNTCLVTIMLANNETGVIQPVQKVAEVLKKVNKTRNFPILVHSDAAQAFGKIDISVKEIQVDYLTIVGHKFYGPRIGAIYHRKGCPSQPPIFLGGGQEFNRRSGTENTPMIAGLGEASKLVLQLGSEAFEDLRVKRDRLVKLLQEKLDFVSLNFESQERLPNTASLCFKGLDSGDILKFCQGKIEASRSAACHSGLNGASSVLIKSGLSVEDANSTLRISVGRMTTMSEIDSAALILCQAVKECISKKS